MSVYSVDGATLFAVARAIRVPGYKTLTKTERNRFIGDVSRFELAEEELLYKFHMVPGIKNMTKHERRAIFQKMAKRFWAEHTDWKRKEIV